MSKKKYCECKWNPGEGIPVEDVKFPFTNIKCPKCKKILKYTATEITAYDEMLQRQQLMKEVVVLITKLSDLLTLLITPQICYGKEFKFKT